MMFILAHPYVMLCAVMWIVCGIVSIFSKDAETLTYAILGTLFVGIGYALMQH